MKTYNNLYQEIYSFDSLLLAYIKAKKGKTTKDYVIDFERHLERNLLDLQFELENQFYRPLPLETFILRDPKTRKISKSDFRDRIVHHALVKILEPIFDKTFIHDSCANRKGKGNLFALERFDKFMKKVSQNGKIKGKFSKNQVKGYCLKADIKHYFQEVDHEVLLSILKKKIADEKVIWLIEKTLKNSANFETEREREIITSRAVALKGMPLGNLTSQFFANIYLNELDYFVKHNLKAKFYIRYVDDFIILHRSKEQLQNWQIEIDNFLKEKLKLELHPQKSRILSLSREIDFVGFRNFYYYKLLRKRNIRKMQRKIDLFRKDEITYSSLMESFCGWNAYSKWANSYKLRKKILKRIAKERITN